MNFEIPEYKINTVADEKRDLPRGDTRKTIENPDFPQDVLDDQEYVNKNDPNKRWVDINNIPDPDTVDPSCVSLKDNISMENEYEVNEDKKNKKDIRDVLINGVPLGKIIDGEVSSGEVPQEAINTYKSKIQKISVNRDLGNTRKWFDYLDAERKGNSKQERHYKSTQAKNSKRKKHYRPYKVIRENMNKLNLFNNKKNNEQTK